MTIGTVNIIVVSIIAFVVVYMVIAAAMLNDTFVQVKVEIERSRSEKGKKYWKRKYRITWLKIIPFGYLIIKIFRMDKHRHHHYHRHH